MVNTVNVYGGSLDAKYVGSENGSGIRLANVNIYGGEVKAVGAGTDEVASCAITSTALDNRTVTVYGGKLYTESPGAKAIYFDKVSLVKGEGYTGSLEFSENAMMWGVTTDWSTPDKDKPYVRVGY